MNADGSGSSGISFGDGRYATPVWSPRGDLIAFTKLRVQEFFIGVMRPDGSRREIVDPGLPGGGADLGAERSRLGLLAADSLEFQRAWAVR